MKQTKQNTKEGKQTPAGENLGETPVAAQIVSAARQ